jgi:hypothetical protein
MKSPVVAVFGGAVMVVLLAALLGQCTKARAQDGHHGQGHAEHHDFYKGLTVPGNPHIACCDNRDCRPTRAYLDDNDVWWAMVDGRFLPVPKWRVLKVAPPDGRSHVCATGDRIICFVAGVPRS